MLARIKDAFRRFFSGRYGSDRLNRFLLIVSVILLLIGWLGSSFLAPWMSVFNILAYVPLVFCLIRMLSRNFSARHRENAAFCRVLDRIRDRKNRYFTCPGCGQTVRVPRGKGKINIRCPKCSAQFIKKT